MKTFAHTLLSLLTAVCAPMGCVVHAASDPVVEGEVVVADPPPPPPPVVEPVPAPPTVGVVWISGYQHWDGHRYIWVRGRYERPPHARARYVPAHWEGRGHGRVWISGRWH